MFLRLTFYKRLSQCENKDDVTELRVEVIDRFGKLPDQAANLFEIKLLQLQSKHFDIHSLRVDQHGGTVKFDTKKEDLLRKLIQLVQTKYQDYKPAPDNAIRMLGEFPQAEQRFEAVEKFFNNLQN